MAYHELAIFSDGKALYRTCSCGRVRCPIDERDSFWLIAVLHKQHVRAMVLSNERPTRIETAVIGGTEELGSYL